jgi:apolipoprotein N-acyltransferase
MTRRIRHALAALSGVLLALSFPPYGLPAIAWVALAPLLVALSGISALGAFFVGLTTGAIYFAVALYWLTHVMHEYGGLQLWTAVLVNVALVAYLALFPALFGLASNRILVRFGPRGLLAVPFVWVASELGRMKLFTGFPWVLLGYSQVEVLPIAQLASVLGVFGLSGLVAAASAALVYAWGPRQPAGRRATLSRALPVVVVLSCAAAAAAWGARRVSESALTRSGQPMTFGLVQGNVDQGQKWDAARAGAIFADYLRLTRGAIAGGAQAVIWPESSTPFFFEEDRPAAEEVRAIAREARVPILVGSDRVERGRPTRYFNSAFMVAPSGETAAVYSKMHLVPFGEYVPLKRLLFFAAPLVEAVSDFSAGDEAVLLPIGPHRLSVAICYEVVYPDLVRQGVAAGAELLTTITNDAWFGRTSAPYQHFAQASMRAIENGRYLVRAANTGISGIVDPYGRVLERSAIFEPAVIVGEARFLTNRTIYTRIGDVFAYASAAATLALLALGAVYNRRQSVR